MDENPILNSPYDEPEFHYPSTPDGSLDYESIIEGRRPFPLDSPTPTRQPAQRSMDFPTEPDTADEQHLINDGSNFVVKQVFFCGGDKDEFAKWKKGIDTLSRDATGRRAERTLKIQINDEAFDRVYGHRSHPIKIKTPGQKIAVRVISQFGEESMKVLTT